MGIRLSFVKTSEFPGGEVLNPSNHPTRYATDDSGGIRTHDCSRRAAVDVRLRPRGHWDRHYSDFTKQKLSAAFFGYNLSSLD
jgi:hypothetical protein